MASQAQSDLEQSCANGGAAKHGFVSRGGWWVFGQSLLMTGVVLAGPLTGEQWLSTAGFVLGCLIFALGGLVGVLGVIHLGQARTAFPRPREGSCLVTEGVYGWVRHPLYSSVLLASVGWGMIWASPTALVAAGVLMVFLDAKARREERWLRERFPEYVEYSRCVKRFVPGFY